MFCLGTGNKSWLVDWLTDWLNVWMSECSIVVFFFININLIKWFNQIQIKWLTILCMYVYVIIIIVFDFSKQKKKKIDDENWMSHSIRFKHISFRLLFIGKTMNEKIFHFPICNSRFSLFPVFVYLFIREYFSVFHSIHANQWIEWMMVPALSSCLIVYLWFFCFAICNSIDDWWQKSIFFCFTRKQTKKKNQNFPAHWTPSMLIIIKQRIGFSINQNVRFEILCCCCYYPKFIMVVPENLK